MQHSSVHLVDEMLEALRAAVASAKEIPATGLGARVAAMASSIDPATLNDQMLANLLGMAGMGGDPSEGLPERLQGVNEILNGLPVDLNGALLTAYFNQMFTPSAE